MHSKLVRERPFSASKWRRAMAALLGGAGRLLRDAVAVQGGTAHE